MDMGIMLHLRLAIAKSALSQALSKRRSLSSSQKPMAGVYGISHPALKQNHYTDQSARLGIL